MVKIIVKNVGQGDSIIIEWESESGTCVGIIDCNKFNNEVPTIEYLKNTRPKLLEFIVLSHPHTDHFSGMYDLLNYCEEKDIKINNFIHTTHSKVEYLRASVSAPYQNDLAKLFKTLHRLSFNPSLLVNYFFLGGDVRELSFDRLSLVFLSPTYFEYSEFDRKLATPRTDDKINNPDSNYLSTIIQVKFAGNYFLLTSDAPEKSFRRLLKRGQNYLTNGLLLTQVPHHGSPSNHYKKFWDKLPRNSQTPAVFSVGKNGYNHPAANVVNSFRKMNYQLFSTNTIGALESDSTLKSIESHLNLFTISNQSMRDNDNRLNGDQSFEYNNGILKHL